MTETVICPGCGWVGSIDRLAEGSCPDCGYENNAPPHRLLTLSEMIYDNEPYNDVRMDLFLQSLSTIVTTMIINRGD